MILAINGRSGSGKDTLGMYLQALSMGETRWGLEPVNYAAAYIGRPNLKGGWEIRKFAYKLKQIAGILLGVSPEKFEDQEFKKSNLSLEWGENDFYIDYRGDWVDRVIPMTVREFLIRLGTEAMRDGLHQDTWINAMFADYKEESKWIITDMRFPNEYDAVKARGGVTIKIVRPDNPYPKIDHLSESALDDYKFDFVITNIGTEEDLLNIARYIMNIMENGKQELPKKEIYGLKVNN